MYKILFIRKAEEYCDPPFIENYLIYYNVDYSRLPKKINTNFF